MQQKILAGLIALTCSLSTYAAPTTTKDALQQYQPYARYFGFDNPETYLKAAGKMEQLLSNALPAESPLKLSSAQQQLLQKKPSDWTATDKEQLQQLWQQNQVQLATTLGVSELRVTGLITEFARYRELEVALEQQKRPAADSLPVTYPTAQLSVPASQWQQWQQLSAPLQAVAIAWFARQQGVAEWQAFQLAHPEQTVSYRLSPQLGAVPSST